jgi:hypothetical protein
VKATDIPRKR